jgi:predicted nucleic acid-binding protein
MSSVVIDTNPLAYIYAGIPDLGKKYALLLGDLSKSNALLIPKIVYGELSFIFRNEAELNGFLTDTGIVIGDMSPEAYIIAAKRWDTYNKRRVIVCHRCGAKLPRLGCEKCGASIKIRQHVLSDFLIGAYALQMPERQIVSHDAGYYATYFPELKIVSA